MSSYNESDLEYNISNRSKKEKKVRHSMGKEPLKIKRRGEDGSKVITVRIKEETLMALDRIASESNYSRNELINIILQYGVNNIEIE